jgi:hypothetical protein
VGLLPVEPLHQPLPSTTIKIYLKKKSKKEKNKRKIEDMS